MILACHNICKSFGTDDILRNVSFHIEEHEKAAVVGINGAGKSTLLKIIVSETDADSGEVTVARGKTIGYLAQQNMLSGNQSIYDEVAMVKQDVIDLEQRLRDLEREMDEADSGQLEAIMDQYHRTQTRFEQEGGYAWKSEIAGVLRGLGFSAADRRPGSPWASSFFRLRISCSWMNRSTIWTSILSSGWKTIF